MPSIVVTDASALERNLNLALQVLEITDRVVVAVNLMDEARRKGIDVDTRSLARDLGVPVIPIVARTGEGLHALLTARGRRVERRGADQCRCASSAHRSSSTPCAN